MGSPSSASKDRPTTRTQAIAKEIAEHPFGTPTFTGRQWPLADVRLLAPILASKVVCIGKNYAAHVEEMGGGAFADPVIFMKPNTSIVGPDVPIQLPADANPVHFEGELAAVIGRPCKDVPAARAAESILGYTIAQRRVGARSAEEGRPVDPRQGPRHVLPDRAVDRHRRRPLRPRDRAPRSTVEVKQHSRTSLMIHDIGAIIEWISAVMTLLPGDLILTGTPEGVGPIEDGDTVSITIEGIGTLTNPVVRKGKS